MLEKFQNWLGPQPSAHSPLQKWLLGNSGQKLRKNKYQSLLFLSNLA